MITDWQIGDRIQNRWEIHKILRGGMGIVYIVYDHHPEFSETFAIKTFQDEVFARAPAIADRFKQEALTWVNLDAHQNVTEARFVLTIAGKPYLFLEYVSGGDLSTWIGTPRLTEDLPQMLRFGIQFCDGMTHALTKGITAHRDIKPQNCLVTQDKTLKVTDFGLAKVFDDAGRADVEMPNLQGLSIGLSRTGVAAGTCTHMAPEQFDDAKHVDVRADIYSFGVMLYQMVTGKLPFVGGSWSEFEQLHKRQRVPPLDHQAAELSRIVEQCLAKDPASRYGGFGEVRDGLAEIYEELSGEEAPQPVKGAALNAAQWGNKGVSLDGLGRLGEALACYDRALEINPRDELLWSNKGKALDELGRPEEALACYDRALQINPRDEVACLNKGNALVKLGRPEEAFACYDRALQINPRFAQTWYNIGVALDGLGRPEEALACYDHTLEIDPRDEQAWHNIGVTLTKSGRSQEALECFDRALEINPRYEKAWCNKGGALAVLGRPKEALACFDRILEINPRDEMVWLNKGNALDESRRPEEALACYDCALEINPRNEKVWFNKGITLTTLERSQEALECFDHALEINPRFALAWSNKGEVLGNYGHLREALACFEEAHRLGDPQAAKAIALCRQMLGRKS